MKTKCIAMIIGAICLGSTTLVANSNLLKSSNISKEYGWKFWEHVKSRKAKTMFKWGKNGITIDVADYDQKGNYTIQVFKVLNSLKLGKKYKISLEIESAKATEIEVRYIFNKHPYSAYDKKSISIDAGKKEYKSILIPKAFKGKYETPRSLRFFLGKEHNNKISLSNIKIEEIE